jgi:hypothetical protein
VGIEADPYSPDKPGSAQNLIWDIKVEYRPGPRIIAGIFPRPGIEATISDPWGNASHFVSGSKPEHGPGGFEIVAPHTVMHTLTFLDERFEILMKDGITFVTLTATPESDSSEPGTGPAPEPGRELWGVILQKLDRIQELIARLPPK